MFVKTNTHSSSSPFGNPPHLTFIQPTCVGLFIYLLGIPTLKLDLWIKLDTRKKEIPKFQCKVSFLLFSFSSLSVAQTWDSQREEEIQNQPQLLSITPPIRRLHHTPSSWWSNLPLWRSCSKEDWWAKRNIITGRSSWSIYLPTPLSLEEKEKKKLRKANAPRKSQHRGCQGHISVIIITIQKKGLEVWLVGDLIAIE